MLVLQLQAFHKMPENRESCICEVWCGKGDADGIKEWCNSMFGTVTMFDLGFKCCQMLKLGINRCSAPQGSEGIASQCLHFAEGLEEELQQIFCDGCRLLYLVSCIFESRNVLKAT